MIEVGIDGLCRFDGFERGVASLSEAALSAAAAAPSAGAGWARLPGEYKTGAVKSAARKIMSESEALVVVGAGGSYVGARAAVEYIRSPEYNLLASGSPRIFFAGGDMSAEHVERIVSLLSGRDFSVSVVSKSGSTIEPLVAFRIFFSLLEAKYGSEGAARRLYVTTGMNTTLDAFASERGCARFYIPDDVGGRFCVLTAAGLLPAAVAGCDVDAIMSGAREEMAAGERTAALYAAVRQALYASGKKIEILGCFEPSMRYLGEWWKQLFGESEGKDGKGIFPATAMFTADLHSLGQYIQQGERILMETFITADRPRSSLRVPGRRLFDDGLDAVSALELHAINLEASAAVRDAHIEGGVPVIELGVPELSAESFGALVYFFESACVMSSALSGVDPYGQPGVESYKQKLRARLSGAASLRRGVSSRCR
ncbi:MAG: glucose-6-phosphate isomerase [Oscillospiraceae bacterium]|jgi:glucose-6-phosphate isomerase|nr:glucose-6-phosphate isomerase [Oscillospiraceae bacterium]